MKFLLITDTEVAYHATGTECALGAGFPLWDCAQASSKINALAPGDELSLTKTASVIRLSGVVR